VQNGKNETGFNVFIPKSPRQSITSNNQGGQTPYRKWVTASKVLKDDRSPTVRVKDNVTSKTAKKNHYDNKRVFMTP